VLIINLDLRIEAEWILHFIESFRQFGILFYQHFATFLERFVLALHLIVEVMENDVAHDDKEVEQIDNGMKQIATKEKRYCEEYESTKQQYVNGPTKYIAKFLHNFNLLFLMLL
jgi:hypothetical protein